MKKSTLMAIIFVVVAILGVFMYKEAIPFLKSKLQKQTSDAKDLKGDINIALDSWVGYYPIQSSKMKQRLRSEGFKLEVIDDMADYASRMKGLADRKYDFAVATIDSDILNSVPVDFPGIIIMVIDESKGADAMVAHSNVVSSLDSFKGDAFTGKIGYTAFSPSHHLLKMVISDFDLTALKKLSPQQKMETKDSVEAFKLFKDKRVQVAILWEPDVTKAMKLPGVVKIIGSESVNRGIVDVLLVSRDYAVKYPERVDLVLKTYFRVLKFYMDNPEDLRDDISGDLKVSKDEAESMIAGVAWVNLTENAQQWFGIAGEGQTAEQGLVDSIDSTVSILLSNDDFSQNPLPDKDPYRIINSSFISAIYTEGLKTGFAGLEGGTQSATGAKQFKPLTDMQWARLKSVGSIKVEPIRFQSGLSDLTVSEKEKLDDAVTRLKRYPTFRILIAGHTSTSGDPEANTALSQQRAEAVARYLMITYSIDENRIKTVGYGGQKPLPRNPGESDRSLGYRLPRVEISVLSESY